ncbi:hypothetical protein ACFRCI_50435 [Streptomyces sp. NPDC056638]|uniref:hypothetical protein n=1 Tax=Streptomyces sp. NPDC056638 TaxID=3345887 RepID=UPI0036AED9BA
MPGIPERRTHDYVRTGVTTLFAAFEQIRLAAAALHPGRPLLDQPEDPSFSFLATR